MEDEKLAKRDKPVRRKWIRPKKFKIADPSKHKELLIPFKRPEPEFKDVEYNARDNCEFQCEVPNCNAGFTTKASLLQHNTKHLDRRKKCTFCGRFFQTDEEMTEHLNEFHPDLSLNPDANPLQCKKCNKVSRDTVALYRHIRESHRKQSYPCPHCNFPFTRPENLKEHLRNKHPVENGADAPLTHTCQICGKVYNHRQSLRGHIRLAHRGKPSKVWTCVICSTTYTNMECYRGHMLRHTNPKFFPCEICNATFKSSSHLKRHLNCDSHKRNARKFRKGPGKVKVEPSSPSVATTTETEMRTKTLSKEELIEMCYKRVAKIILWKVDHYIVKKSIKRERAVKKAIKSTESDCSEEDNDYLNLNCLYCQKDCPNLSTLKHHEKICYMSMRSKKLHICNVCDKEFETSYKLKLHSITHTDERNVKCRYCPSLFKTQMGRIQHEKGVHFGTRWKPSGRVFKCNFRGCSKQYKEQRNLKRHIASIHLGKKYSCHKCDRVYNRDDALQKHLRRDHAKCPLRLVCRPCKRTYKDRTTYLRHLNTPRHLRKSREAEGKRKKSKVSQDSDHDEDKDL